MSPGEDRLDDARWRVWDQAWTHARHLETMRGQYLGFFFTAVLGVAVLAGKDLIDDGARSTGALLALSVLALALDALAAVLLLAVARLGDVMSSYNATLIALHEEIRGWAPEGPPPWIAMPTQEDRRDPFLDRLRSSQGAAESVLKVAVSGFPVILALSAVRSVTVAGIPLEAALLCFAALALGIGGSAVALWAFGRGAARDRIAAG
jgi:hypothetical protein